MLCSYLIMLKLCTIVDYVHWSKNIPHFLFSHMFKRDNWHLKQKQKNFNVGVYSDTIKARSFKLCVIITLLGVYIVIIGLMTLTWFQGHKCVRNIICKSRVWILVLCSLNVALLLHTLKRLRTVWFVWQ